MNAAGEIREDVTLPDPAVQPLVHPLDLPEARPLYRNARLFAAFTGFPVAALIAAIIAYLTRHVMPPLVVVLSLTIFGALSERWYTERAWDYIPRKRQDRDRPPPKAWEIGSSAVLALVLGVALLLVVVRLDDPDVTLQIRSFTFGGCAVAAGFVVVDVLAGLLRPSARRRALAGLAGMLVVVAATILAWTRWFAGDADTVQVFWGAATLTGVAVVTGAIKLWGRRRAA